MIPEYSRQAAKTIGFLKSALNDVEIYVEDSSLRNAYRLLFRKWIPEGVRFSSVTS